MAKLSLNKAAAYAGKAKADILKVLKSNDPTAKLSGEKNDKGHWEIETSELDRVFGKRESEPVETDAKNRLDTPVNVSSTSALEIEVATLREQLRGAEKEQGHLNDKIDDLRQRAERAEAKEDELRRLLPSPSERKGFWARLVG